MMAMRKDKAIEVLDILDSTYPDAQAELNFSNPFELLVAVVLSAQTTDVAVNKVTEVLFKNYKDANELAEAKEEKVRDILKRIGMYKTKAKNIIKLSAILVEKYNGEVPKDDQLLVELPGVGRKTANVVMSVAFGEPRIAVDTHVFRVSNRIGIVSQPDVLKTELALMKKIPKERWSRAHHTLIFHGRRCCKAINPQCHECPIKDKCRYKDKKLYNKRDKE